MASENIQLEPGVKFGRRLGRDRRSFSYSGHIPERRCLKDRRSQGDIKLGSDTGLPEPRPAGSLYKKISGADHLSI